jgi:hypothetical protein
MRLKILWMICTNWHTMNYDDMNRTDNYSDSVGKNCQIRGGKVRFSLENLAHRMQ